MLSKQSGNDDSPPPCQDLPPDQVFIPGLQNYDAPSQPVDQLGFQHRQISVLFMNYCHKPVDLNIHL